MNYNFDELTNRKNQDSLKWGVEDDVLPMWVADMDFKTAPCIIEALKKRVDLGIFGYNDVPSTWYEAYISWWERRHNFTFKKEWMMFVTGVVPAISSIVRKVTTVGENVLVLSPVYNIFYNSIINNGRNILESKLVYKNHKYSIDFKDLEEKLSLTQTTLMILCNPHNPIGKIWDKNTLKRIGALCKKYNVLVISDEIHCDIVDPGFNYIPFASVNNINKEISITCISISKCFNLAGLQTACIVVPNKNLYAKVNRGINTDEVAEPSSFAITAAISALNEGEDYLNNLNEYIFKNKEIVRKELMNFHNIKVIDSSSTYLLWIDISSLKVDSTTFTQFLKNKHKLYLSDGNIFKGNGGQFLRMNVATQKSRVEEGLRRFKEGVNDFLNS